MDNRRKRKNSNSTSYHLDIASKKKAEKLFEKKAVYLKDRDIPWDLPDLDINYCETWSLPELQHLKQSLNTCKDQLSDKEISQWHSHTQRMNLAGSIVQEMRQQIRPELCTQAWCKFYELVSSHDIVDFDLPVFNSVHLCEAPGAFVTSLNHYLISKDYRGTWTWYASTLNPWYEGNSLSEMIDDDHFIQSTREHWYFGVDDTGNLMEPRNLEDLIKQCKMMGKVHLVTADGSIDCQDDPAEQEHIVSRLHYCEALAAMSLLTPGGNLVLKKFTMFESDTVCLMYLLNCLFNQVHIMKPATSKSGNSEIYIVCKGFLGHSHHDNLLDQLIKVYFGSSKQPLSIFKKDQIPTNFLSQHITICRMFTSLQEETIQNNLDHFPLVLAQYEEWVESVRDYCADLYLSHYEVQPIPPRYRIVPHTIKTKPMQNSNTVNKDKFKKGRKRNNGTFIERVRFSKLPWKQRVQEMEKYDVSPSVVTWFSQNKTPPLRENESLSLTTGRQLCTVQSSKFTDKTCLQQMNEFNMNTDMSEPLSVENFCHAVNRVLDVANRTNDKQYVVFVMQRFNSDAERRKIFQLCPKLDEFICSDSLVPLSTSANTIYVVNGLEKESKEGSTDQEITSCDRLVTVLKDNLKCLSPGNSVILLISTCLTRFTAGVLYLLSQCFHELALVPQPGAGSLQQLLLCQNFHSVPDFLTSHIQHLTDSISEVEDETDMCVLESVSSEIIFSDLDFMNFLQASNDILIKSYINHKIDLVPQEDFFDCS